MRRSRGIGSSQTFGETNVEIFNVPNPSSACCQGMAPDGSQVMCPCIDGIPQAPCVHALTQANYDPYFDHAQIPNCGYEVITPNPIVSDGDGGYIYMSGDDLIPGQDHPGTTYTQIDDYQAPDGFGVTIGETELPETPYNPNPPLDVIDTPPVDVSPEPAPVPTPQPTPTPDPVATPNGQAINLYVNTPAPEVTVLTAAERAAVTSAQTKRDTSAQASPSPSSSKGNGVLWLVALGVLLMMGGKRRG